MKVNIQDSNINLDEFIKDYLSGVSEELINHPQLRPQLIEAITFLTRGKGQDELPELDIIIGENGQKFVIKSGIRKSPECKNPNLQDNKNYDQVVFEIDTLDIDKTGVDKRKGLAVTRSTGTFYKTEDYIKNDPESEIGKKAKQEGTYYLSKQPTVIAVYHDHRRFSREGIEIERTTYDDKVPCSARFDSEFELKFETNNHKPSVWNFNTYPSNAPGEFHPTVTNQHRYKHRLGIVTLYRKIGRDGWDVQREAYDYVSKTEFPEYIEYSPEIFKDHNDGKITERFTRRFPEDTTPLKIESEMALSFYNELDSSKTREYRPELLDEIRIIAQRGLKEVYGIRIGEQPVDQHTVSQ